MLLGYNTNGFAHHSLEDALTILLDLGYQSIALTLDHNALNPFDKGARHQLRAIKNLRGRRRFGLVIETGARFLLDPKRKHWPTLLDPPQRAAKRLDFLKRAIDIAGALESPIVSLWSGAASPQTLQRVLWKRLITNCRILANYADRNGVALAFEPEPGMFIDTMERYAELHRQVDHRGFGLTLDIGHLYCQGELPIADHIRRWRKWLWNVHIEDMRRGVHDHLMFGEGEINFGPVMQSLRDIGYEGGVHVELSRHSHDAVETASKALAFLQSM